MRVPHIEVRESYTIDQASALRRALGAQAKAFRALATLLQSIKVEHENGSRS